MNPLVACVCGLLFALGLGLAGMTRPERVLAFLEWRDPGLMWTMADAVAVTLIGFPRVLRRDLPLLGLFDAIAPTDVAAWFHAKASLVTFPPLFNVGGQPAMGVPLVWSDAGLPIGAQFAAPIGKDELLLALAGQLERARPWSERRPPVRTCFNISSVAACRHAGCGAPYATLPSGAPSSTRASKSSACRCRTSAPPTRSNNKARRPIAVGHHDRRRSCYPL